MNVELGLSNHETYVLTNNRFNIYMVLIFSDLNKAHIYKIPYRNSPHEIEILMSFDYLICLDQMEKRMMEISYSKLNIKNTFMWEKK